MKLQTEATNVLSRTSAYLKSGVLKQKPVWFDIVAKYPPSHKLVKKPYIHEADSTDPRNDLLKPKNQHLQKPQLFKTRPASSEVANKNNQIHRIPKLTFLEDELRNYFYLQHPWELSRPKNLIENNGDEISKKCDWSQMLQLHKPLDGESVIQRAVYLLHNDDKVKDVFEAYDIARFEFYRLRMAEEMESHIAREESTMYGAVYESTNIDWNLTTEQKYIDDWVKLAAEQTRVLEANSNRSQAPSGSLVEEEKSRASLFESLLSVNSDVTDEIKRAEENN
ncbi:RSM25 [Candida theae]|uniref:37S ribosomal protein S25, mitochondrial n=1 Tax=Candida theae TaxID=1198502 RepID=A0AAD5G0L0_9ASCO|nr:RSM25 [Candida theae]KAI5965507.1 RSM25 [Candida theae]